MLSPIIPTMSYTIEDIPNLDIFAKNEDVSSTNMNDFRPMFPAEGASLLADELMQAGLDCNSDSDLCQAKRPRKAIACKTELELSTESTSGDAPRLQKRKQSLLEGIKPKACKFETILLEDDDSIDGLFLGKRGPTSDNGFLEFDQLNKHQSVQFPASNEGLMNIEATQSTLNAESKRTCGLGHRLGPLSAGADDCYLCRSVLANIKRFAEEKGGQLLSSFLTLEVTLCCENNHQWNVCYKKATKSWCKDCKVKRKQLLKEMLQAEDERIAAERKMRQEKLFEDVRKRAQLNEETKKQESKSELESLKIVFEEITRLASKYAREYCQKDESAEYEQTLLLYQTLILPEKCLSTYFTSLSKVEARKEFRRYTILLHPDKNSHPKAKQAFQKAYAHLNKILGTSN